jgi:hypothetical protein
MVPGISQPGGFGAIILIILPRSGDTLLGCGVFDVANNQTEVSQCFYIRLSAFMVTVTLYNPKLFRFPGLLGCVTTYRDTGCVYLYTGLAVTGTP